MGGRSDLPWGRCVEGTMIDFLRAHDIPNWAVLILVFLDLLIAALAKVIDKLRRASAEARRGR